MQATSQATNSITRLMYLQALLKLQNTDWEEIEDMLNAIPPESQENSNSSIFVLFIPQEQSKKSLHPIF